MQGVPGFVPRVLRDAEVGLFRAEDRVFDAMIDGWKAQMMARGLATQTIEGRCRVLRRFQEYAGTFPWTWRPVDLDDYVAGRRSGEKPISLTTLRSDSNAIAMFCAYTSSPTYGWGEFCEQTFGDVPAQIAFDWNTPRHTTDDAVPPQRRAFKRKELQKLFGYMDDLVDREYAAGSKRWLPALRDSIAFKVCCAYGLRRREVTMLDLHDFGPNPHLPAYGEFGAVTIRWAKGTAGSGPRRRTVLTVPEFEWVVDLLKFWIHEGGRDRFPAADRSAALWPSERADRITLAASVTPSLPRATPLACPRSSACTACATPTSPPDRGWLRPGVRADPGRPRLRLGHQRLHIGR